MIVVTTPTGNIGRHVVQRLVDAGEAVRVIVRDAARLPTGVRAAVDVVEGSHGDAAVVGRAFEGADAVFWLCPPTPAATPAAATVDFARHAADAVRRHGVRRVVAITNLGRNTAWQGHAGLVTSSIAMVDMLRRTGAAVRGLALPALMDNALQQVATIRQGMMFGVLDPDRKVPHTAARDTGAVAADFLLDRSWTDQSDVPVIGPEELSENELAAIIADVIGCRVSYRQVTFDAFKAQLMGQGITEAYAQGMVDMMRAKNEGMDNVAAHAASSRQPTHFREWAEASLKSALGG